MLWDPVPGTVPETITETNKEVAVPEMQLIQAKTETEDPEVGKWVVKSILVELIGGIGD